MGRFDVKAQRLVAVFVLGCVLFNFPVLAVFNRAGDVFGIPVLYAYIFLAWAALIALVALIVETGD